MLEYIYVVSFAPSIDSPNSSGGFDWFYTFEEATEMMRVRLSEGDGWNLTLTKLRLAAPKTEAGRLCITQFINYNLNLVEVDLQPEA